MFLYTHCDSYQRLMEAYLNCGNEISCYLDRDITVVRLPHFFRVTAFLLYQLFTFFLYI